MHHILKDWSEYDPFQRKEQKDPDYYRDDIEMTYEDVLLMVNGFHPMVSPEEAKVWEKKQEQKRRKAIEDAEAKIPKRPWRYVGRDNKGRGLELEYIKKGSKSDYFDPVDLKTVSRTYGYKQGMDPDDDPAMKLTDESALADMLEKQLEKNFTIVEPWTGYKWNYTRDVTLTSKRKYRDQAMAERYIDGYCVAVSSVEVPKEDRDGDEPQYDQIAVYVDYKAARDWFVENGAQTIPQDLASKLVPEADKTWVQRAAEWYLRGWPKSLNPFPHKIRKEFSRQEEAFASAFRNGKFAKTIVIKFGGRHGLERWRDFLETMRAECSTDNPRPGGASEAYRFDLFIQAFQEVIDLQEENEDGELVIEFDSENRPWVAASFGDRFATLPLEDPKGAFQVVDAEVFRAADLILGAFSSRTQSEPFSHLKSIFIGASKSLFLTPDRDLEYRQRIADIRRQDDYDLHNLYAKDETKWRVDQLVAQEKAKDAFKEQVTEYERRMHIPTWRKVEGERTSSEVEKSDSYFAFKIEEEDPEVEAAKLELQKGKISKPMKLPQSLDGGLTYNFYPPDSNKIAKFKVEHIIERDQQKRSVDLVLSPWEDKTITRAQSAIIESILPTMINDTFSKPNRQLIEEQSKSRQVLFPYYEDVVEDEDEDEDEKLYDHLSDTTVSIETARAYDEQGWPLYYKYVESFTGVPMRKDPPLMLPQSLSKEFPVTSPDMLSEFPPMATPQKETAGVPAASAMSMFSMFSQQTVTYPAAPATPPELESDFPSMTSAQSPATPPDLGDDFPSMSAGLEEALQDDFPSMSAQAAVDIPVSEDFPPLTENPVEVPMEDFPSMEDSSPVAPEIPGDDFPSTDDVSATSEIAEDFPLTDDAPSVVSEIAEVPAIDESLVSDSNSASGAISAGPSDEEHEEFPTMNDVVDSIDSLELPGAGQFPSPQDQEQIVPDGQTHTHEEILARMYRSMGSEDESVEDIEPVGASEFPSVSKLQDQDSAVDFSTEGMVIPKGDELPEDFPETLDKMLDEEQADEAETESTQENHK